MFQVGDLVRPHHPAGAERVVPFRRPAIGRRVGDGGVLHPADVMEVAGVPEFVDVLAADDVGIAEACGHGLLRLRAATRKRRALRRMKPVASACR